MVRITPYTIAAMIAAIIAVAVVSVLFALGTGLTLLIACVAVVAVGKPDWSGLVSSGGRHRHDSPTSASPR